VAEAILGENLLSVVVPVASGGLGGSRAELFEAVEEVARADGSAGWCVAVCNGNNAFIHRGGSEALRQEIFGSGPVSSWASLLPKGRSQPEGEGFRLTGSFGFGSGSSLSDWVLVSSLLPERDSFQWFRAHVVPKHEVRFKPDSWDVMGLKATHSVDYDIDTFVPSYRTFDYPMLPEANPGGVSARDNMAVAQVGMVAFASGVAQAALEQLLALAPKTKRLAGDGFQSEDHTVQFAVAELEGRLRAARCWYLDLVEQSEVALNEGASLPPALPQAAQTLTRAARDTAVFAFDCAGTTVIYSAQPLQRMLRDIFAGLKHAQLTPAILGRIGRARLGVESAAVKI
jgi:alkylation response protein AidB-like acyl-CoA dehydrogenase